MFVDALKSNLPLVVVVVVAAAAIFYLWRQLGEARRALLLATKEECTGPLCDAAPPGDGTKPDRKKRVRFSEPEGAPTMGAPPPADRPEAGGGAPSAAAPPAQPTAARGAAVGGAR